MKLQIGLNILSFFKIEQFNTAMLTKSHFAVSFFASLIFLTKIYKHMRRLIQNFLRQACIRQLHFIKDLQCIIHHLYIEFLY